jgi:hypothetical protein
MRSWINQDTKSTILQQYVRLEENEGGKRKRKERMKCDATTGNGMSPKSLTDGHGHLKGRVALATDIQFQTIVLGQTGFVRADSRRRLFCGAKRIMIG